MWWKVQSSFKQGVLPDPYGGPGTRVLQIPIYGTLDPRDCLGTELAMTKLGVAVLVAEEKSML